MRVFWVYFWTKGKQSGEVKWMVKWKGKKHIVDHVVFNEGVKQIQTVGRARNPHGIIRGKALHLLVIQNRNGMLTAHLEA